MKTVAGGRGSVRNLRPRMGKTVGLMKGTGAGNPCGPRFGSRKKFFGEQAFTERENDGMIRVREDEDVRTCAPVGAG